MSHIKKYARFIAGVIGLLFLTLAVAVVGTFLFFNTGLDKALDRLKSEE